MSLNLCNETNCTDRESRNSGSLFHSELHSGENVQRAPADLSKTKLITAPWKLFHVPLKSRIKNMKSCNPSSVVIFILLCSAIALKQMVRNEKCAATATRNWDVQCGCASCTSHRSNLNDSTVRLTCTACGSLLGSFLYVRSSRDVLLDWATGPTLPCHRIIRFYL